MKAIKTELVYDKTRQKESASQTQPKHLLEAFECIVELAENTNLDKEFFTRADAHIKFASDKLCLTPMQTVLLALFVDRSENDHIHLSDIADYVGCRTTKMLRLSSDVDVLENMHYLRVSRSRKSLSYRVPSDVLKALKNDEPYVYTHEPVKDVPSFFDRFKDLAEEKREGELTYNALLAEVNELLDEIHDSHFVSSLRHFSLNEHHRLLFIFMSHLFFQNSDDCITFYDIDDLYDNATIPGRIKIGLRSRNLPLFERKLIENTNEGGMASADRFKLTDFAKEDTLTELNLTVTAKSDANVIKSDSFAKKELIYNPSEEAQVKELASILSEENFNGVQARLRGAGMRSGFCCLFYGSPGTGKTETVYQIARATGRDIIRVDVDKIKSCWVGESEQNIKKYFDRYRNICKSSKLSPILLFNEADAVLGVRMEGAVRSVDKMENSIQNIILQEMESLEGIMIATTNLTCNLDKAFERRFLYKIQFNRPTADARARIWQAMLPSLSDSVAHILASRFDFSGGEIENIVRKYTVNRILSGEDAVDLSAIINICRDERISNSSRSKMGYRI